MDVSQFVELAIVAASAAVVGSMLGLGGGVFLVPIFTLFFGLDQKVAIGASAVAVVTNSVVGSSVHLRSRFTNLRLAMLLQVTMSTGATAGAIFSVWAPDKIIDVIFGLVLLYAASTMVLKRTASIAETDPSVPDDWEVGATFTDPATKKTIRYVPREPKKGLAVSGVAGVMSGLLGVGGGVIQVPAMNLLMKVPVKAAAGTSSFMVGFSSVATAFVYYSRGKIDPTVVVPAMIGIFAGSQAGSRLTRKLKAQNLVLLFTIILIYLSLSLLLKSVGVTLPGQK